MLCTDLVRCAMPCCESPAAANSVNGMAALSESTFYTPASGQVSDGQVSDSQWLSVLRWSRPNGRTFHIGTVTCADWGCEIQQCGDSADLGAPQLAWPAILLTTLAALLLGGGSRTSSISVWPGEVVLVRNWSSACSVPLMTIVMSSSANSR